MEIKGNHSTPNTSPVSPARMVQAGLCTLFAAALYYRIRSVPTSLAATAVTAVAGECLYRWIRTTPAQLEELTLPAYPVATETAEAAHNRYNDVQAYPWNILEVGGRAINASWMPRRLFCEEGCKELADAMLDAALTNSEVEKEMGLAWRRWVEEKVSVHSPDYIATQGPLEETCELFWEMVWQQNTPHIICLTNLQESYTIKCHPYWPQDDAPLTFGPFTIQRTEVTQRKKVYETTLEVTKGQEKRSIVHLHHTGWGDQGVIAKDDMEALIKRDEELYRNAPLQGPVVVHCSAGVGRTGTFLGCKIGHHNPKASPADTLAALRACRDGMVQTRQQERLVKQFYDAE